MPPYLDRFQNNASRFFPEHYTGSYFADNLNLINSDASITHESLEVPFQEKYNMPPAKMAWNMAAVAVTRAVIAEIRAAVGARTSETRPP